MKAPLEWRRTDGTLALKNHDTSIFDTSSSKTESIRKSSIYFIATPTQCWLTTLQSHYRQGTTFKRLRRVLMGWDPITIFASYSPKKERVGQKENDIRTGNRQSNNNPTTTQASSRNHKHHQQPHLHRAYGLEFYRSTRGRTRRRKGSSPDGEEA
jgi:hypothetical protein